MNRSGIWALAALMLGATGVASEPTPRRPNCVIFVSEALAATFAETPIDRVEDVYDNILGTDIFGVGHTRGKVVVDFRPCDSYAAIDLVMQAQTSARTTGYNGPVRLHSDSVSAITARKRVCIDQSGVRFDPACSVNSTRPDLRCITTTMRGPVLDRTVRKIAYKKYDKDKDLARRISEDHVNDKVRCKFDDDSNPKLLEAAQAFEKKFREPLIQRRIYPADFRFATTEDWLIAVSRLAADDFDVPENPKIVGGADGAILIHESMLNTGADRLLSGKTYSIEKLREEFADVLPARKGPISDEDREKEKIAITFADRSPVEFRFDGDQFKMVVRGTQFIVDDSSYTGMNITVDYRIERTATGIFATRIGDIQIYPPNFTPGKDRLSSSQVALRRLLQRHLVDVFATRTGLENLVFSPTNDKSIRLLPTQATTASGWLTLAVRLK